MKNTKTKLVAIVLFLFFYIVQCHTEGFAAGTLVKISAGYKKIEDVRVGDRVICCDKEHNLVESSVVYVAKQSISQHVRICVDDEWICAACDQRLYDVRNDSWIVISDLKNGDNAALYLVDEAIDVYVVGVAEYHNFFVTKADICVHNFVPVIVVAVSAAFGSGAIEIAGVSAGIAGLGTFLGYQWHKKNKKHSFAMQPQFHSGGMIPEDPEEEKKKKRDQAREEYRPLSNKEARAKAKKLGYKETKNHPCGYTHDKPVFTNGRQFISPDKYGHKGGVWKVFDAGGARLLTTNIDLTVIIGK